MGGGLQPPPAQPWSMTLWTFFGVFSTLLVLSALDKVLTDHTGYGILLAPFGALMTLQFSLTQAPVSQPRNALYGQTVAISIALFVKLTLADAARTWIQIPITGALAIAAMGRLGVIHPPAGAASILFASSDKFDGVFFGLMLVGNAVAIVMATLINNLNSKKQYPVYYAFVPESWIARFVDALERDISYFRTKKLKREVDAKHERNESLRMSLFRGKEFDKSNKESAQQGLGK
mmetsp:Transcript_24331/g.45011  ORF Transcript_24331/g.45011 Transcript_24331/m.45011 type:complete len:234 (-) Transcript_24331:201-902(-)